MQAQMRKTLYLGGAIQGYMDKEGHLVKNWKRRVFFLKVRSAILEYYDDRETDWLFKGQLDLKDATLLDTATAAQPAFKLVTSKGKTYNLRCENCESQKRWMAALSMVISGSRNPDDVYKSWTFTR